MSVFLFVIILNFYLYKISIKRGFNKIDMNTILIISMMINIISVFIVIDKFNYLYLSILISIFTFIFYIDFKKFIIFDEFNLLLFIFGLIYIVYKNAFFNLFICIILFVVSILLNIIMSKCDKEYIGGGDLKLISVMSLYVGFVGSMFALTIASSVAIIYYIFKKSKVLPYGPFLSIGYSLVFLLFCMHII